MPSSINWVQDEQTFSCDSKPESPIHWTREVDNEEGYERIALLNSWTEGGSSYGIISEGIHLFVTDSNILRIFDVADPLNPLLLASVELPAKSHQLFLDNNYVIAMHDENNLHALSIIDVSEPFTPILKSCLEIPNFDDIAVDEYIFLSMGRDGIQIIDFQNREKPIVLRTFNPNDVNNPNTKIEEIVAENQILYFVAHTINGDYLKAVDVANPTQPVSLDFNYRLFRHGYNLMTCGSLLFAANSDQTYIFDKSSLSGQARIKTYTGDRFLGVSNGDLLFSGENDSLIQTPASDIGLSEDLQNEMESVFCDWQLYPVTFQNYAFAYDCCGLNIYDISEEPATIAKHIPSRKFSPSWLYGGSFSVNNGHAYFVVPSQNLQIMPLGISSDAITEIPTDTLKLEHPWDVAVTDRFLFILDKGNEITVATIEDPLAPQFLAEIEIDTVIYAIDASNDYLYILVETGLMVFHVSTSGGLSQVGFVEGTYNEYFSDIQVSGNVLYASSGDVRDEKPLLVFDITNPTQPVLQEKIAEPFAQFAESNGYIVYHAGSSKLHGILDIKDRANPIKIASGISSSWIVDIDSDGDLIYVLLCDGGMVVFDTAEWVARKLTNE
ncbi:MAG: hypothetical protein GY943_12185 [Chloroflexi bacterium]|nr:hypothetical protein [Chloroflexota bacterium]